MTGIIIAYATDVFNELWNTADSTYDFWSSRVREIESLSWEETLANRTLAYELYVSAENLLEGCGDVLSQDIEFDILCEFDRIFGGMFAQVAPQGEQNDDDGPRQ